MLHSILPKKVIDKLKKHMILYNLIKNQILFLRTFLPKLSYPGLPGKIHPNDFMLKNSSKQGVKQYYEHSREQFKLIEDNLALSGKNWSADLQFIEIGCGYGRIARWVATAIPTKNVSGCDVIPQAVKFCRKELNINAFITDPDFKHTPFKTYDIVFSCSLLTHLSKTRLDNYLMLLGKICNSNGIVIFSIHGDASLEKLDIINHYLNKNDIKKKLEKEGFYFHSYPHYKDKELGDTFFTINYLQERVEKLCPQLKIIQHIKGPCYAWLHDWIILKNQS